MSILRNINTLLDDQFKNHDYLPQRLLLEDLDMGAFEFIKSLEITLFNGIDNQKVPVIWLNQERWAEFRNNWQFLRDEGGKEITMPFLTMRRVGVKQGEHPLKRFTIPGDYKKHFTFLKVPIYEGNQKAYDLYKIPQPSRVDVEYELRFFSHYMQHTNVVYETILSTAFSSGQAYLNVNGHYTFLDLGSLSEDSNEDDIAADRRFQIICPMVLHGKIVDPTKFTKEKVITKIQLNITES